MSTISKEAILEALKAIIDPDFKKDIVSLGFVKNIQISSGSISLDIELTTHACPLKAEFKKTAEKILSGLEGVNRVTVNMTSRKNLVQQNQQSGLSGVKNIIAIASCKGGVGKSTVAANIALELAGRGLNIGLLDTDLFGPSVPTLFNIHRPKITQNAEGLLNPVQSASLKLMSFGFLMGEGPAIMRGPMVSNYIQQILFGVNWGELDYLLLDLPPGTGDVQLTITQTVKLTGAIIVTTRQSLSLVDVEKGIEMFEAVKVPMLGIVENMSYFVCDNCDKKHYIFGSEGKTTLEERYGLETLAELPVHKVFSETLNRYVQNADVAGMVDKMIMSLGKKSVLQNDSAKISQDGQFIYFDWQDGMKTQISHMDLRSGCRCAECVNEYTGEKILDNNKLDPQVQALEIIPVGQYAVAVNWSDGHNSGIYSYQYIRKINQCRASSTTSTAAPYCQSRSTG